LKGSGEMSPLRQAAIPLAAMRRQRRRVEYRIEKSTARKMKKNEKIICYSLKKCIFALK
jgi:hypothetical protein